MRVVYHPDEPVLSMSNGRRQAFVCKTFAHGPDVALRVAYDDPYDVVGLILLWPREYLPLGNGYDPEKDVLTIGETTDDPAFITENDDFVGYWETNLDDPRMLSAIGVAIYRASQHLGKASQAAAGGGSQPLPVVE